MADYRKVHTALWNDERFPFMSDDGKLVVLHLMTSYYSNCIGCYKCSLGALADELRWELSRYKAAFQEAADAGFAAYDTALHVVYLPRFLRDNPPANPNVLKGWVKKWLELPASRFRELFLAELEARLPEFGARDDLPNARLGFCDAFERCWRKYCGVQEEVEAQARLRDAVPPAPGVSLGILLPDVVEPQGAVAPPAPAVGASLPLRKHEKIRTDYSPEFQRFWAAYPKGRAISKPQCYLVWRAHQLDSRCEEICAKIERLKVTTWKEKESSFITTSPVWLNQGRWEDDLVPLTTETGAGLTGPMADALACIAHYEEQQHGATGVSGFHRPAATLGAALLPVSSGKIGLDGHAARVF